jgi:DNA topoisomerase VI subunit B
VVLKELVDNALDAAEDSDIAPKIDVTVSTDRGEGVV